MRNEVYYRIKPFLPWEWRMRVRRWHARRLRRRAASDWPILPSTSATPVDWPGWPGGRRFAFLLTHDVEGSAGLARVRRLAELEMSLGFRSAFNFIPEGEYTVPPQLLAWLKSNGFEVGVHDLYHNGSLYRGRSMFRRQAAKINHYLKEWDAAGFRSGFMLNNLEWLHDLEITYDASTFDNDPFEPQPQGTGTIFPFWVTDHSEPTAPGRRPKSGYVELPYTLPQDSTLFLLLQEKSPDLWLKKLDWVTVNGGMALVNVHPDYLRFDDERPTSRTYPIDHYLRLLAAAQTRNSEAWLTSPKELAEWFSTLPNGPRATVHNSALTFESPKSSPAILKRKRAAVILYSTYPSDSRPRRAAEALVAAGVQVELLCLQETPRAKSSEEIAGVKVTRAPLIQRRGGRLTYGIQYGLFFAWCSILLAVRGLRRRFDVVHAHNMPDFLVWAAFLPRLRGAKVILDLHDPMPELFMSLFEKDHQSGLIRLITALERRAISFADLVLTPNESFRQRFAERTGAIDKIRIVMNSPQEDIFSPKKSGATLATVRDTSFRLMYHGLIAERHGLDIAVEAIAIARRTIPELTLDIFGAPNAYLSQILELSKALGLAHIITCHGMVSEAAIAAHIEKCHLGIVPNRLSPFTSINLPTRIFEYLAMDRPVIVPATQGILDYFNNDNMIFFKPNDSKDLARQIIWVHENPARAAQMASRGRQVYQSHRWQDERARFLTLVAGLMPTSSLSLGNAVMFQPNSSP